MSIENIQELNVGLNGAVDFKPIKMKQFDKNTRRIEITLLSGSDIYEIPNGAVAKFQATKPDGTIVFDDCSIENGMVVYKADEQLSTCAGTVKCEVGVYEPDPNGDKTKDKLLQSSTFNIWVEESAMDRNAVISSNEFNTLTIMINTITGLVERAENIIQEINIAISNTESAIAHTEIAINNAEQATSEAQQATAAINTTNQTIINSENARIESETKRQSDETIRQSQESTRQTNTTNAITRADAATTRANLAAEACEDIASGIIELPDIGTSGTYTKVTTDAKGRVVEGNSPTNIEGLGVTNVYNKSDSDNLLDAKIDKTNIANNLITTVEGTVLGGEQGKILNDKIGTLSSLTTTSKTDLVGSVNEVKASVDVVNNDLDRKIDNPFVGRTRVVTEDDKYNAWANICRTSTGRLIVAYAKRDFHNFTIGVSGKLCYKYSDNAGVKWSDEIIMLGGDGYDYSTTSIGTAQNGNVVCIARKSDGQGVSKYLSMVSTDDGLTFGQTFDFANSTDVNVQHASVPNMPITMDNGKMMILTVTYTVGTYGVYAIFSSDNGLTWNESAEIFPNTTVSMNTKPTEIRPTYLGNGKIIAIGRNQSSGNLYQLVSTDYGLTWTVSTTNIDDCAQHCAMATYTASSDTLALYYTNRLSNTINRRVVRASFILNNPTRWSDPEILDYTSGIKTQIDAGYTTSCLISDNSLDTITAFYTTRDVAASDNTSERKTGIVIMFDRVPKTTSLPTIAPTQSVQSNYTVTTLYTYEKNGWCFLKGQITVVVASTSLVEIATKLPCSQVGTINSWFTAANGLNVASLGSVINGDGVMSLRYGEAGRVYQFELSYPCY